MADGSRSTRRKTVLPMASVRVFRIPSCVEAGPEPWMPRTATASAALAASSADVTNFRWIPGNVPSRLARLHRG